MLSVRPDTSRILASHGNDQDRQQGAPRLIKTVKLDAEGRNTREPCCPDVRRQVSTTTTTAHSALTIIVSCGVELSLSGFNAKIQNNSYCVLSYEDGLAKYYASDPKYVDPKTGSLLGRAPRALG